MKRPINHASTSGYPTCGRKQRPCDPSTDFPGDVVVGALMRAAGIGIDCEACLRIEAAMPRVVWAA